VYDDLHNVASDRLRKRFGETLDGMTISPTSLTNDVAIALMNQRAQWQNSEHFIAIATRLMLRLITDYQRERLAATRGGGNRGRAIGPGDEFAGEADIGALNEESGSATALIGRLHELYPRKAEVVTLNVIADRPLHRVAQMLGVSIPTVERDWRFAKAWLSKELRNDD